MKWSHNRKILVKLFQILMSSYLEVVTPVKTGVQKLCNQFKNLDFGFRWNDGK